MQAGEPASEKPLFVGFLEPAQAGVAQRRMLGVSISAEVG